MSGRTGWTRSRALVASAVGFQWLYNGGNYVAFKIGGDVVPPLTLALMRFAIAGALILPVALLRSRARPPQRDELLAAAGLGIMMLVGGQALGMLGTHLLPAGIASVFGASAPIFLALFAWAVLREPLGRRQVYGIGLGFAGLALMAWSSFTTSSLSPLGVVLVLGASACWAAGSLWSRRLRLPEDPAILLATQLVTSAAVLAAMVGVSGEAAPIDISALPTRAWWVLGYLIVVSTLAGYALFLAINADVSPTIANSFAYAAPVVALLLSAVLLGEPLTFTVVLASGVTLSGVALMVRGAADRA